MIHDPAGRRASRGYPDGMLLTGTTWAILLLLGATALFAHRDDPKASGRVPPYAGPGFRSSMPAGSVQPFGGALPNFPRQGVQLLSWIPLGDIDPQLTSGSDCWGYASPSGREYALFGHSHGMTVLEVTNPGAPLVLTTLPGPVSIWRDIKVYGHHAYVVSEGVGADLQVVDLSLVDAGVVTLVNTVTTGGTSRTHNLAIDADSGFLYRCGGGSAGALRIYSLADPANPTYVATWPDRYVHDCQVVTYTSGPYSGKQIAFCCTGFNAGWVEPGIDILDVTDKQNIVPLDRYLYPGGVYSHQAWLSEDRQYLFLNDEVDEQQFGLPTTTLVIDVSTLTNPFLADTFTNGSTAVGHNLYTRDQQVFEANYRSGLRVFDISNPLAAVETAFFDTWPDDDLPHYNGLWNVYPYFPSGVLLGSDLERGLFLWYLGPVTTDCNLNSIDDAVELQLGIALDCNGNGVPDACDLMTGVLVDADGNGVPDNCACVQFVRGEVTGDGQVNLADAIAILGAIFGLAPPPSPSDAADVNDDGALDISDPVRLLTYLFALGPAPSPPFPTPGCDP